MKYKNLLFDLDGTLTDSSEGITKSALYTFEKMQITPPEESELYTFIGPPLGYSFVKHGVEEKDKDKAVAIYRERYNSIGKFENAPYRGMIDLLKKFKDEGYKLYVATSKPEKTAIEVLDHFDMTGYFDEIAGATVDGSREKKDDVIRYLLDKIGEDESDTVMIGDTNYDVLGAAELGIPCIAVTWGFGDIDDMKKSGAVAIVSSMDELYEAVR
ncbi:HAD-IA family hydrolase [Butyrivibrio sp. AE2005]|uniref:HAD-IA family hydrolase n=1 Tax=Butyrivibrio sp. AE2005 TaxID=1496722 RepID=UPI0005594340|nr:HAD-IA family hydrolase [Butyrivibrio sp. AE2005]